MSNEKRPGDWYRDIAERYEAYAETFRGANAELARQLNLSEGAKYRAIGARVDYAMRAVFS